jgi:hypothetical protein
VTSPARAWGHTRAASTRSTGIALVLTALVVSIGTGAAGSPAPAAAVATHAATTFPARGSVGAHPHGLRVVRPAKGVLEINRPTVLRNTKVVGGIDVNSRLTMRNVVVASPGTWWGNVVVRPGAKLVAEDCTISPTGPASNPARRQDGVLQMSGSARVTIRRCDITGTAKGALVGTGARIVDSWLHDFTPSTDPATGQPTHKEAVMSLGGSDIRIIRCRCEANNPEPYDAARNPNGFDPETQTAAITLQSWSPIRNLEIRDSFVQGGYYALRIESHAGNRISGLRVEDTVFGPPRAGFYTYDPTTQITAWDGNVQGDGNGHATGDAVPRPEEGTGS